LGLPLLFHFIRWELNGVVALPMSLPAWRWLWRWFRRRKDRRNHVSHQAAVEGKGLGQISGGATAVAIHDDEGGLFG